MNCDDLKVEEFFVEETIITGKSFPEALIFASTNPQYGDSKVIREKSRGGRFLWNKN